MGRFDSNGVGLENARGFVWDSTLLTWVKAVQAGGGGSGGSTQVSVSGLTFTSSNELVVSASFSGSTIVTVSAWGTGLVSSGVAAGNSSALTVRNVWSSTNADQPVRTDPAIRHNIGSTAADNAVTVSVWGAGIVSSNVQAGNSSALTVRNVWSSTNADQPVKTDPTVRHNIGSTAADNAVNISGNSTVFQGGSPWVFSESMQSSLAPSSGSSGVIVRQVIDNILTTASTNAFAASTSFVVQSSGAALRSYVTAYSILSTNAGPSRVKFYSSGTMTWPVIFAAVSSAVSGANLAVSAPAYLFRSNAAEALTLQLGSGASTLAGFQVAVSYFRAP